MSTKRKEKARVISQNRLAPGIYDLRLFTEMAKEAEAGQFVGVYTKDASKLLPRPISICEADKEQGVLRLVYRIAGEGTAEISTLQEGQQVELLGVLGSGFPLCEAQGKQTVLMGGGIGIPPMLELAKELKEMGTEPVIIAGYRDGELFLKEDLERYGKVLVATEDGSVGIKGNVLTVVQEQKVNAEVIMACGPMPMLRAIKSYAVQQGIKAYISLEERMACGVGACLGCVCTTTAKDPHSHVKNARICTDGPVFEAREVDI